MPRAKTEPQRFENSFERAVAPLSIVNPNRNLKPTGDCFEALVRVYRRSTKWIKEQADGGYSDGTKGAWGRELDYMCRPEMLGAYPVRELSREQAKDFLKAIADRPGKQQICLTVLRVLEKWAISENFMPAPITTGIELEKSTHGHMPWEWKHVALALAALKDVAPMLCRAIILGYYTGQRVSDLVKMGPRSVHTRDDGVRGIRVVQKKTGHKTKQTLFIPIGPELAASMDTWGNNAATYLHDQDGEAMLPNTISQQWARARDKIDALSPLRLEPEDLARDDRKGYLQIADHFSIGQDGGLVLHGLRGSACVRLRRLGASESDISRWVGMSIPMVTRYCRGTDQEDDTVAAARRLGLLAPVEHAGNVVPLRTGT